MPLYAQYDPTQVSGPVLGWYDTDAIAYPTLPPAANLLTMTAAQWASRFATPWVTGGVLVAAPPRPVVLNPAAQLAARTQFRAKQMQKRGELVQALTLLTPPITL